MPYTKEYLQNLRDEDVRKKDEQTITKIILEIEEEVLYAARTGKEFYEWRSNACIPRIQQSVYQKLLSLFIGCKVTKTEFGFYVAWI